LSDFIQIQNILIDNKYFYKPGYNLFMTILFKKEKYHLEKRVKTTNSKKNK